jgi:hypothetical protein
MSLVFHTRQFGDKFKGVLNFFGRSFGARQIKQRFQQII